jgi:uncharacterized protein YbjT (DUF2867 family)
VRSVRGVILVVGATGKVGGEVLRQLLAEGAAVRALSRAEERTNGIRELGAQVMVGDLAQPETLEPALEGVERVFVAVTPDVDHLELEANLVEAAKRAGTARVVKVSALLASPDSPVRFGRTHSQCEELLAESGLAFTILRANGAMQNLLPQAPSVASQGKLYAPVADAKVSWIDVRDLARAAVLALTEDGHDGKRYRLTGPEAISSRDQAEVLSEVLGTTIECVEVDVDAIRNAMLGAGAGDYAADGIAELFEMYATGRASAVTDGVAEVTGSSARSFADFARDYSDAFKC